MMRYFFGTDRKSLGELYAENQRDEKRAQKKSVKKAREEAWQREHASQVIQTIITNPDGMQEKTETTYIYNKHKK